MSTVLRHITARTQACKPQGGNQARTGENEVGAWVNVIHKVYGKVFSRERDLAVATARTEEINTRATQLHEQLTQATAQNAELVRAIAEGGKKHNKPEIK
jgi:hypothetical protein